MGVMTDGTLGLGIFFAHEAFSKIALTLLANGPVCCGCGSILTEHVGQVYPAIVVLLGFDKQ
jgi:hypothetical protein